MQYALAEIPGKQPRLICIYEHVALLNHGDAIKDLMEDEASMPLKLVYGAYKTQLDTSLKLALDDIKDAIGKALGHVMDDQCRWLELCDIELIKDADINAHFNIPFAAIVRTHISIPISKSQAVTAFRRYTNLDPGSNILNRHGVFAFKAQERRIKPGALTVANWREHIDCDRAIRAARAAI